MVGAAFASGGPDTSPGDGVARGRLGDSRFVGKRQRRAAVGFVFDDGQRIDSCHQAASTVTLDGASGKQACDPDRRQYPSQISQQALPNPKATSLDAV